MGIGNSSASCKPKSSTSVVPNPPAFETKEQDDRDNDALLDALENGTPSPNQNHRKQLKVLHRLKQQLQNDALVQEDVVTSGSHLLQRLSMAAMQKAKFLPSDPPMSPRGSAASLLPRDKLVGLALRKYFRDADSKKRGYLTTRGVRKALSSILKTQHLPSPPDTVTNEVMKFLGRSLKVDKNGRQTKDGLIQKLVVKESVFVGMMRYGEHVAMPGRPPILALCASLIDMQLNIITNYIDRLWKTYQIQRTRKMGYEELHELLKHLAPKHRHIPTIDETCTFLGAIKSTSKKKKSFNGDGDNEELELTLSEFAEYVLRGMYQTRKAMKTFSSRGPMQAKIIRCLNALSEEAMEDHLKRRNSLSRRPSASMPSASLLRQFEKFEGIVDGSVDAT